MLLGKCTGIGFVDSTPMRVCHNRRIHRHKVFNGIQLVTKVKGSMKNGLMSVADKLLLRKMAVIESVNDELKNITQLEHSRHRGVHNLIINAVSAIAAYCLFPKEPSIVLTTCHDNRLTLF